MMIWRGVEWNGAQDCVSLGASIRPPPESGDHSQCLALALGIMAPAGVKVRNPVPRHALRCTLLGAEQYRDYKESPASLEVAHEVTRGTLGARTSGGV